VRGASDAAYLITAFGEELLMQLQLNVHRLVVVYRVPALDALDASTLAVRLERWRIGAEHAGWKFGWRDSPLPATRAAVLSKPIATPLPAPISRRRAPAALLVHRHWQMARYYMIEAARGGIRLSPRRAGFPV
jgi:hypothetical protein